MRSIKEGNPEKIITEKFSFDFDLEADGLCLIEVIAGAKSWWQNFKSLKSFLKDEDIVLAVDRLEITTSRSRDADVRPAWNGNELKGLLKTVVVAIKLKKGKHALHFTPDRSPYLKSIKIFQQEDAENIIYSPSGNNPAQAGQGRPWLSFILINLAVKNIVISAMAGKKRWDDDDLKLIINGEIQKNQAGSSHKDWYWCGKINKGGEKEFAKSVDWRGGLHYLDLYADESPFLNEIILELAENKNLDKLSPQYIVNQVNELYKEVGVRVDDIQVPVDLKNQKKYDNAIDLAAKEYEIDPFLLKATLAQESKLGSEVDYDKRYVGHSGLTGLQRETAIKQLESLGHVFDYSKEEEVIRATAAYYKWLKNYKSVKLAKFKDPASPLKLYTQYRIDIYAKNVTKKGIKEFLYYYFYYKNQ